MCDQQNLSDINQTLHDLVEQAYSVFGQYRVKKLEDVCTTCCISPAEEQQLLTTSVSDLSRALLCCYTSAAKASCPTQPNEYKHFFPRYLELLTQFTSTSSSVELTFDGLRYYQANTSWSDTELQLLNQFSTTFFSKLLLTYPMQHDFFALSDALVMFDKGDIDIAPLLEQWRSDDCDTSLLHFKDLVLYEFSPKKDYSLGNVFAEPKLSRTIKDWVSSHRTHFSERIEHALAYNTSFDEDVLFELSSVYNLLDYHFRLPSKAN